MHDENTISMREHTQVNTRRWSGQANDDDVCAKGVCTRMNAHASQDLFDVRQSGGAISHQHAMPAFAQIQHHRTRCRVPGVMHIRRITPGTQTRA